MLSGFPSKCCKFKSEEYFIGIEQHLSSDIVTGAPVLPRHSIMRREMKKACLRIEEVYLNGICIGLRVQLMTSVCYARLQNGDWQRLSSAIVL